MHPPRILSLPLIVCAVCLTMESSLTATPVGKQILRNADFTNNVQNWELQQIEPAEGEFTVTDEGPNGSPCARVELLEPGDDHWKMSVLQKGLIVRANKSYRITFMAKADRPRWVSVDFKQHLEPYKGLAGKYDVAIGTSWSQVSLVLKPSGDEENARFSIGNLGMNPGILWFTDFLVVEE